MKRFRSLIVMAENSSTQAILGLTAQIVSAHVSNNVVSRDALPDLITQVYNTLISAGADPVEPEKLQPAVPIKKSVFPRVYRVPGRWQKAEDAEAPPADFLQHDARAIPG